MNNMQKAKYKYSNRSKNNRKPGLDIGLKGFLCSCNNREKDCVREAYNLLNKYADILYPSQKTEASEPKKCIDGEELNIEEELENELLELKSEKKNVKRFQVIESGAKNFLFIKTTMEDPVHLAHSLISDLHSTKIQQTRFLIRLTPIETTCRAYLKDIEVAFLPLAEKYFKNSPRTFSIVYNHRNNNNLNRDEIITAVANIVATVNNNNKVDLKSADVSIVIEVIKGIVLIGVVPDFIKFKKYNLLSVTEEEKVCETSIEKSADSDEKTT
ncbi:THUMP domain-containing protein 1 [Leptinotarsa decemlineata]|uniref:THUMP domain-containing protein 1 n=1 Tax=Leptinotarsa decemlineata TaxID=7539 RepID=UPI003D306100